jgi:methyl coenzyme M reductase subunit D
MCKILTHNIWDTVENSVIEVRKATMKARMLTGTYILQVHKNKFNQAEIDTICPQYNMPMTDSL